MMFTTGLWDEPMQSKRADEADSKIIHASIAVVSGYAKLSRY